MKTKFFIAIISLFFALSGTVFAQGNSYETLMKSGNASFAKGDYYEAKSYYEKAAKQKPNDAEAKKKITLTLKKIEEEGLRQEEFYAFVDAADALFAQQKYAEAQEQYRKALKILPNDEYAKGKDAEISGIMQQRKEKQAAFDLAMTQGQRLMDSEDYDAAIMQFQEASKMFPDDKLPKEKIAEATQKRDLLDEKTDLFDKLMAEATQLERRKNYNGAIEKLRSALEIFPNDSDIQNKISQLTAINEKTQRFNDAVTEADLLYQDKAYKEAKTKYQNALTINPDDTYTKDMISRIDAMFNSPEYIANEKYNAAIAKASSHFTQKQYDMAINAYNEALSYKPNDEFATTRISEINALLDQARQQAEAEQQFASLMRQGDNAAATEQLNEAIDLYSQALQLKPGNKEATDKINGIRQQIAANDEVERQYSTLIAKADVFMNRQKYDQAVSTYREALQIKPNEVYPQQQIASAESIIAAQKASAAERQALIDRTLAEAKAEFDRQNYPQAKDKYQQVLVLESTNKEASSKIKQIDDIVAQAAREREQQFSEAMRTGRELFDAQQYAKAIPQFSKALGIKPEDETAQQYFRESERLEKERVDALLVQYNGFIKEADKAFNAKEYDKATDNYKKADNVGLDITYPAEMIAKITRIIEENKLYELNTEPIAMASGAKQRFTFKPIDASVRRSNYVLLKLRNPNPGKEFQMIVSFGGESGKNGGFVLPVSESEETQDYIIRIGALYKWFSENNTWIEFVSENDEVEIQLVEISKS